MGVRLILVSLVAGLGLTIPSASQVKHWTESAQAWVFTRLAEMDARMPADESAFVYVNDGPAVLAEEPTPAAETATVSVPEPTKPAATEAAAPNASALADAQKLADELAAGLEVPFIPAAIDDAEAAPSPAPSIEPAAVVVEAPAPKNDAVAIEAPAPKNNDDAFLAAQSDVIAAFVADLTPAAPVPDETPKALIAKVVATPSEPIAWNSDAFENDPAEMLANLVADAFAGVPEAVEPIRPDAPAFTPIAVEEISAMDIAVALNVESEGLLLPTPAPAPAPVAPAVVSTPTPSVEEPRPDLSGRASRLGHAVRLTREAVYAWANLLHGPAVVTIAH